jgi:hypothetical protein
VIFVCVKGRCPLCQVIRDNLAQLLWNQHWGHGSVYPSSCQHFIWQLFCASWHVGLSTITWSSVRQSGSCCQIFALLVIYNFKFSIAYFLFAEFYLIPEYSTDTIFHHSTSVTVSLVSLLCWIIYANGLLDGSDHGTNVLRTDSGKYYLVLIIPMGTVMEVS